MRLTTLGSAAVLALSATALAQVGQAPEEQKLPANAADPDDTQRPEISAGSNAAEPAPGAPSTALVNSIQDDPPTPVGQRPPK